MKTGHPVIVVVVVIVVKAVLIAEEAIDVLVILT
jgi:hypothetical protein